jgi:hypothetical protein
VIFCVYFATAEAHDLRALYGNPVILFLSEASSALDERY